MSPAQSGRGTSSPVMGLDGRYTGSELADAGVADGVWKSLDVWL
jgi:hypothetical protein